jgi:hypothetical protein
MKPTKQAQKVIAEIHASTSIEVLDEISQRPMPWLDHDKTDDAHHIRDEVDAVRKDLLKRRH